MQPRNLLSRKQKRRLRLSYRFILSIWRNYPRKSLGIRSHHEQEDQVLLHKFKWKSAVTPIPNRGDDTVKANRLHNLSMAISALNGISIPAGGTFSLSHHIGEPTEERGYASGPAFINGRVSSDAGGGLCLIATNLYLLFLRSGFHIIERHNHSIDAYGHDRFYELGEDAAISFAFKDLVTRNNFSCSTTISIRIENNVVHSSMSSCSEMPVETVVRSQIVEKMLPYGNSTNPGWVVMTSRYIKNRMNGHWKQDYVSCSHYKPC